MKTKNDTLPGKQWAPSNSDVGYSFLEDNCTKCARDKSMSEGVDIDDCDDDARCDIIARSFIGEAIEWRKMPDGEVKCLEFIPAGNPLPMPRCEKTVDMFGVDNETEI